MENRNQPRQNHDAREQQNEWHDHADTSKYLDMDQHGVSYTHESHPTMNSDYLEFDNEEHEKWRMMASNSRNADAFSQDDYILRDNLELDDEQNTSISSDEK
jgi:hypothetical protein